MKDTTRDYKNLRQWVARARDLASKLNLAGIDPDCAPAVCEVHADHHKSMGEQLAVVRQWLAEFNGVERTTAAEAVDTLLRRLNRAHLTTDIGEVYEVADVDKPAPTAFDRLATKAEVRSLRGRVDKIEPAHDESCTQLGYMSKRVDNHDRKIDDAEEAIAELREFTEAADAGATADTLRLDDRAQAMAAHIAQHDVRLMDIRTRLLSIDNWIAGIIKGTAAAADVGPVAVIWQLVRYGLRRRKP